VSIQGAAENLRWFGIRMFFGVGKQVSKFLILKYSIKSSNQKQKKVLKLVCRPKKFLRVSRKQERCGSGSWLEIYRI